MNNLISLINIPVPPMLEKALGYDRDSRYVAFYWELAGASSPGTTDNAASWARTGTPG
jgi:hypothetical protein